MTACVSGRDFGFELIYTFEVFLDQTILRANGLKMKNGAKDCGRCGSRCRGPESEEEEEMHLHDEEFFPPSCPAFLSLGLLFA